MALISELAAIEVAEVQRLKRLNGPAGIFSLLDERENPMITTLRRSAAVLVCAFVIAFDGGASLAAQTAPATPANIAPWGLLDAIGYGGLGLGMGGVLGVSAAIEMDSDTGVLLLLGAVVGGTWAGILAGGGIGNRAARAIEQGAPLSPAHRTAVAAGAVLAGVTIGAIAAIPLINPEGEGTPLGSDEQTLAVLVGAGAGLALLYVKSKWGQLAQAEVTAAPIIGKHGQLGLLVRLRP